MLWNWRPTLQLLLALDAITEEDHDRMGTQVLGGRVDSEKACRIADAVAQELKYMNPGERMLASHTVTKELKKLSVFSPNMNAPDIDENDLYSASYEWLQTFEKFCRLSGGFEVM